MTSTNASVASGADCHHDCLWSHHLPFHWCVTRASLNLYIQDTAFLCILDGVLRIDAGTSPVTEFKEETDRILAERVETGHWQTLSTTDAGVTEKWIPATPATDMVMPRNARSPRLPHSCCLLSYIVAVACSLSHSLSLLFTHRLTHCWCSTLLLSHYCCLQVVTEDATEDEAQDWKTASVNASDDTYQWVPDTDGYTYSEESGSGDSGSEFDESGSAQLLQLGSSGSGSGSGYAKDMDNYARPRAKKSGVCTSTM